MMSFWLQWWLELRKHLKSWSDYFFINQQNKSENYFWKLFFYCIEMQDVVGKQLEGFENYIITEDGKVYSKLSNRFLKPSIDKGGRAHV